MEPKETPHCLIPCLLVVFTWHLEILVTTLPLGGCEREEGARGGGGGGGEGRGGEWEGEKEEAHS